MLLLFGGLTLTADAFYEKRQEFGYIHGGKEFVNIGCNSFLMLNAGVG